MSLNSFFWFAVFFLFLFFALQLLLFLCFLAHTFVMYSVKREYLLTSRHVNDTVMHAANTDINITNKYTYIPGRL